MVGLTAGEKITRVALFRRLYTRPCKGTSLVIAL
jgi:hypothetical protein